MSNWLELGIDIRRRTVFLLGEVNEAMVDRVVCALHVIRGPKPIHFYIHSEGGHDDDCRAIIGAMLAHSAPIHGHVIGIAESAAAWILQKCEWRIMYPHSSIMLHMGASSKTKHSKYVDKLFVDDVYARMLEKRPDYNRTTLVSQMDNDWNVYPTQAVELGLADEIRE